MHLYIRSKLHLEELANQLSAVALVGFDYERRDGLNLGGGEYFKFANGESEIVLVCNDSEHAEVFVESRSEYPFYCYVWRGTTSVLESMSESLTNRGVACELADDED